MKRFLLVLAVLLLLAVPASAVIYYNPEGFNQQGQPGNPNSCNWNGNGTTQHIYENETITWDVTGNASFIHFYSVCCAVQAGSTGYAATSGHTALWMSALSNTTQPIHYEDVCSPGAIFGYVTWTDTLNTYRSWLMYNATASRPIVADFNATPLMGPASLHVTFTDNSTGGVPTAYNWSISPMTGVYMSDANTRDMSAIFSSDGNFTVSHGVSNAGASDIETKTDYIWVRNASDVIRTGVMAVDGLTGYPIHGAQVDIQDIENSSWTNTTTAGGYAEISCLVGHNLNIYGSNAGYEDGDLLNVPAIDQHLYTLPLFPTLAVHNATPGNVTLYVTLEDSVTLERLPNFRVSMSTGASYTLFTNENGLVRGVFPNRTYVTVGVPAQQGYQSATQVFYTGTEAGGGSAHVDGTILVPKNYVTTPQTTVPGGTVTTTQATIDPYPCSVEHPENCQRKQTDLANTVLAYAPQLVLFFIMLTFVGGIKMMGK